MRTVSTAAMWQVFWTLGGVVVGIALGAGLYAVHPSKIAVEIIGEQ